MSRIAMMVAATLLLTSLALIGTEAGQAGNGQAPPWKPFLPDSVNGPLTGRSLTRLSVLGEDKKSSLSALRAEALIVAGYSLSSKDNTGSEGFRNAAARIAIVAAKDDGAGARTFASAFADGVYKDAPPVKDWRVVIGDIADVMNLLATHAKKGEGIHADLQYNDRMKKQNGVEALINALAAKKLTDANLGKMSKEMELLGYRVATIGALTLRRGPGEKKKDAPPQFWDEQAVAMRDAAIEWAQGAGKKDGAAVFEACKRLENTCVECHSKFK